MTVEITRPFYVADNSNDYSCSFSETLEGAQQIARRKAWESGEEYIIYKAIAVAEAPEQVNSVKVTEV